MKNIYLILKKSHEITLASMPNLSEINPNYTQRINSQVKNVSERRKRDKRDFYLQGGGEERFIASEGIFSLSFCELTFRSREVE